MHTEFLQWFPPERGRLTVARRPGRDCVTAWAAGPGPAPGRPRAGPDSVSEAAVEIIAECSAILLWPF